jgi:hypothetical protein
VFNSKILVAERLRSRFPNGIRPVQMEDADAAWAVTTAAPPVGADGRDGARGDVTDCLVDMVKYPALT